MTKLITQKELSDIIDRIFEEKENQAKYNGKIFTGLTETDVLKEVNKRIGNEWKIVNEN
jgi:predicted CopG family antitoxin